MKVSAPQFMSSSAPPADAPAPTPETPADPSAPPPPPEPPKQAVWPDWFPAVDNALIVFALLFAFLMASFAARNSDLFRHMASGQRLLHGTYSLGSDPFTYTGADRPWVNQNWLFDLTAYAAHSADNTGAVAVVLKAVVYAAAFGVLLCFRRPGQAGWPWAMALAAAALAASGSATLRPIVFGMLFWSLLLLIVFRGDWVQRRQRTLLLVGVVCWLWGGFDSYAILAPLLLVVVAGAGALQKSFELPSASPAIPPSGDATPPAIFATPPAPNTLFLAAAVALLGVMLNPTFVVGVTKAPVEAVSQLLPFELSLSTTESLASDQEFRTLNQSLLSSGYWKSATNEPNLSSTGLFVLVFVGAIALALGVGRPSAGLIALWFATLLLCFLRARFLPLFCVVAVPLVGGLLNALSARFALGTTADKRTQGLLTASRLGRILSVPAFLALLAAAVPGWLHQQSPDPAFGRRLEWRIAPDEALARGIEQLGRWRASGDLPAEARGLFAHLESGDYAAWFAPAEPAFANSRYRFHRAELDDLIEVRNALFTSRQARGPDAAPSRSSLPIAEKYDLWYLVFGKLHSQTDHPAIRNTIFDLSAERPDLDALWHLDGRVAVVGRSNTARLLALRAKLAFDPVRQAFGPQPGLPDGPCGRPPEEVDGWVAGFLDRPLPLSGYTSDAQTFAQLSDWTSETEELKSLPARRGVVAAVGGWATPGRALADAELALPLLVHRAARRGVEQSPNDPRAYLALGRAYQNRVLPEFEPQDAARQRLTALARCAARLPSPQRCPDRLFLDAVGCYLDLFVVQAELGHFDLARDTVKRLRDLVTTYAESHPELLASDLWWFVRNALAQFAPRYKQVMKEDLPLGKDEFQFEEQAKKGGRNEPPSATALLKKLDDAVTAVVGQKNSQWDQATRGLKAGPRAVAAPQFGLHGKALELLDDAFKPDAADPGAPKVELALSLVAIQLEVGRLEQAHANLADLEEQLAGMPAAVREGFLSLKLLKLRRQGNFKPALAVLDELRAGRFPKLPEVARKLAIARPKQEVMDMLAAVAPPLGTIELLPVFRPPADARREARPALEADFNRAYVEGHPIFAGQAARARLLNESVYYYQRGVLALYDGDTAAARDSFARVLGPQGIDLLLILRNTQEFASWSRETLAVELLMPARPLLPLYIRAIDRCKDQRPSP